GSSCRSTCDAYTTSCAREEDATLEAKLSEPGKKNVFFSSQSLFTVKERRFIGPGAALVFVLAEFKVSHEGLPPVFEAQPPLVSWKNISFQNLMITTETASAGNNRLAAGLTTALNDVIAEHHPIKGSAS